MFVFDPFSGVLPVHVLPHPLEQPLIVLGLQALAAGALHDTHPFSSWTDPSSGLTFEAATASTIVRSDTALSSAPSSRAEGGAGGCKKIMARTFSVETMVGPSSLPARAGKAASEKSSYRLRELVKNL